MYATRELKLRIADLLVKGCRKSVVLWAIVKKNEGCIF